MKESVIDFPKASLCPEIWEKVVDANGIKEIWQLKPEVRAILQEVYENIIEATQQHFNVIHITGSITSNSYTENADIDMHFLSDQYEVDDARAEEINKMIRAVYKKTFVGKHPVEVYFQPNKFQDMMSVGCYDFFKNKWIIGPELIDQSFNPYSAYYKEIQDKSVGMATQIRNMIFSIYEMAVVMKKNIGTEFHQNMRQILIAKLEEVQKLYDSIRNMRKVYSSPISKEQALKFRSSRKWKIADGAFKLFDKYGYMAILKQFITDYGIISSTSDTDLEVIEDILSTVKKYINNADKLSEKELYEAEMSDDANEDEQLDEGTMSNMLLATLLAIPGILPANTVAKEIKNMPKTEVRANSKQFQKMIKDIGTNKKIGNFSEKNAINILAWTLWCESASETYTGKEAIASTIFNRAGGKVENLVPEALRKSQYSEWNDGNQWGLVKPTSDADWTYRPPKDAFINKKTSDSWSDCVEIATKLISGNFKSTIGKNNMVANKKLDNKNAWNAWGKNCKLTIGNHSFGYDKSQDGYIRYAKNTTKQTTNQHVVKKGDSLSKIASKYNVSLQSLLSKNDIKDPNKLKIGQKLKI